MSDDQNSQSAAVFTHQPLPYVVRIRERVDCFVLLSVQNR